MGTLFLDEIGEMDISLQAKLLRAIEEGEIERLGGGKPIKVDIRLIAGTNRNLRQAVADGRFREDLYFRLNVLTIRTPPLRDRLEDVPLLAHHFISRFQSKSGRNVRGFTRQAVSLLATTIGRAMYASFGMSFSAHSRWAAQTLSSRRICWNWSNSLRKSLWTKPSMT
jgi:transcriptional regulator with PAS, ATPase and Fis domain